MFRKKKQEDKMNRESNNSHFLMLTASCEQKRAIAVDLRRGQPKWRLNLRNNLPQKVMGFLFIAIIASEPISSKPDILKGAG